ncbi:MAG: hypothetical protein RL119_704 [Actinomycetota bacterium]
MGETNSSSNVARSSTLIFDGDCAFCTSSVEWAKKWMKHNPNMTPWQRADLTALGLTQEQCETAVQFVDAQGRISSGEIAVARLLLFAGRGWKVLGGIMLIPGIRQVCGVLYRWVARNRHRLPGGTAACALPPASSSGSDGENR